MRKTGLITGATDGVGKATAAKLLREGWEVAIVGRNPIRCEATVAELKDSTGSELVSAIVADLSVMTQVKAAAESFVAAHDRLDFLFLNANAITQRRVLTVEGFESNFAIGHLGRALLAWQLQGVLEATPGAQVMTVVGLNVERLDFDDLTMEQGFTAQAALARWQWAAQAFAGEFNRRSPVPVNIYIPGLVKTKILADEPQPRRTFVKVMNAIIGISTEKAAENVFAVLNDVERSGAKGVTYAWKKRRKPVDLELREGDSEHLWSITDRCLEPYR